MTWLGLALMGLFIGWGIREFGRAVARGLMAWAGATRALGDCILPAAEEIADAKRFTAKCAVGLVRRKEAEPEPLPPDFARTEAWITENLPSGSPLADDVRGMVESILGRRPCSPEKKELFRERLRKIGCPMPGMTEPAPM